MLHGIGLRTMCERSVELVCGGSAWGLPEAICDETSSRPFLYASAMDRANHRRRHKAWTSPVAAT
jgi:hypothetical protein